jgi:hypothetical protein
MADTGAKIASSSAAVRMRCYLRIFQNISGRRTIKHIMVSPGADCTWRPGSCWRSGHCRPSAIIARTAGISRSAAALSILGGRSELIGSSRIAGIIGLVVGVGIIIGVLIYSFIAGGVKFGSIAANTLIANAIGSIVVAVLLFVLGLTVVGAIIAAIIGVWDAIALAVQVLYNGQAIRAPISATRSCRPWPILSGVIYKGEISIDTAHKDEQGNQTWSNSPR